MRTSQRSSLTMGIAAAAACMATSACAQAGAAPDRATIVALLTQTYEPNGNTPTSHLDVTEVEIGSGHRASAHEGMQFQVNLGQMIYPVHVRYSLVNGSGPSASIRDWNTHFFAFRSEQKQGRWDLTSNSVPGDINGNLRGG